MSVLINMEMPTSCGDCRFCGGIADTDCGPCAWCDVDGTARVADTRQDCPLVPVPPHGRLIDADALKDVQQADADFFKGSSDYGEKCRRDEALNAVANIVNAPTIIEAEEPAKKDGEQDGPYDLLYEEGGQDE